MKFNFITDIVMNFHEHFTYNFMLFISFFFLIKLFLMRLKFCDRFLVKLFSLKSTDFKN